MNVSYAIDLRRLADQHVYPVFQLSYQHLLKENNRFRLVLNSSNLLLQMYQSFKNLPFQLHSAHLNRSNELELVLEKSSDTNTDLLLVTRYKCPGPIAEVIAKVRELEPGQHLWVALFIDKITPEKMQAQLEKRDYCIAQIINPKPDILIMQVGKS